MKVRFEGFHDSFSANVSSVSQLSSNPEKVCFGFSTVIECLNVKRDLYNMGIPSEFVRCHSKIAVPCLQGFGWDVYS